MIKTRDYTVRWSATVHATNDYQAALEAAKKYFRHDIEHDNVAFEVRAHDNRHFVAINLTAPDHLLTTQALRGRYGIEHPFFKRAEWQRQVATEETIKGYWTWVYHSLQDQVTA